MLASPVIVALPIADRRTSHAFYRDGLGLDPLGEPADDGMPEPLQFALNEGARLMLIPSVGFGWVIGDHTPAPRGESECLLSVTAGSEAEVVTMVERARRAGAAVVSEPQAQPWGFVGTFADPDGHLWTVSAHPWP